MFKKLVLFTLFTLISECILAQTATLKGQIVDEFNEKAAYVNVSAGKLKLGTVTDENGNYELQLPANKEIEISIQGLNYYKQQFVVSLKPNETKTYNTQLEVKKQEDVDVIYEKQEERKIISTDKIDVKKAETLPNISGGVETYLQTFMGVQKNNELSSAYSVRGGNFDENLVYVNDFEIYRPFLIRSGQQEGLSFVNPDMVDNLTFSSGGFQAKYGDKMASVLDVTYRKPKKFGGSVMGSLLGANIHLEGTNKKTRQFTYTLGFRYKTNKLVLSGQDTKGQYVPSFIDLQGLFSYAINEKLSIEYLVNFARNRFLFTPSTRSTEFGLINFQSRFTVYYEGQEDDRYQSLMNGLSLNQKIGNNLTLKYLVGAYNMQENEHFDIIGDYYLQEIETDPAKENVGEVKNDLGSGTFHDWARNQLNTTVIQSAIKGTYQKNRHELKFGLTYKREIIQDKLSEWERRDSAGYSMPTTDTAVLLFNVLKPEPFNLKSNRFSGYIQDTWKIDKQGVVTWNYGVRFQYWDVNKEWVISPRTQFAFKPKTKADVVFTTAAGMYAQPPFYREMRNLQGQVNTNLKAQKSAHFVAGIDYAFKAWKRPFKFTTEGYYKYIWDAVPYEFDNVLIRYFGKNNSKGYVAGIDFRLHGELAKGAESWISMSIMKGEEDVRDDYYTAYDIRKTKVDANGQTTAETKDTLSVSNVFPGYIPRPTDQRLSFALFFQDYIPKFPYLKVHMNLIVATGLPFGPPDNNRYKDTYRIPPYRRFDIGFSALLFDIEKKESKGKVPKSFFQHIDKIWLSFEVYNILGIENTISYIWIDGLDPRTGSFSKYAVPNYLTDRRFNLKFKVDF